MVTRSNVHRQVFWRRVRSGIRTGVSALLTAVLALTPQISTHLTVPFFASVTAIIITDSSLGRTIHNAVMVFWGCIASSVTSLIFVEVFGRSYTAMLLTLTVTAFVIAYPDVHVLIKKFGLALAGIDFITFAMHPHSTPLTFPLRLSATTMLGALCAVLSMILPTPLKATSLVRHKAELAAKSFSALLSTQMDAFCALEARQLSKLKVQAGMLRQAVLNNLQSMKERQAELWWEFRGGAPTRKLKRLIKVFDTLLMHSASIDMALQTGHIHESPKFLLQVLRQPLSDIAVWTNAVLTLAVDEFKGKTEDSEKVDQVAAQGTELLKRFNETLRVARERAYYGLKSDATIADAETLSSDGEDDDGPCLRPTPRQKRRTRVESLMKCSVESLITSQFFLFNTRHIAQETLALVSNAPVPPVQQPRPSFSISRRASRPCKNPDCAASRRTSHSDAPRVGVTNPARKSETGTEPKALQPPGTSQQTAAKSEEPKGKFAGALAYLKRFKLNARKLKGGSKVALAVGVAGLLGVIASSDVGFWGVVTVGFIIGGYQGGSFRAALLRLQGTVAGAVYGYLVILLVHGHPVAVGALLVPWVALVTFIRYSKAYGYSGVVAGFTAAIIALGYRSANQDVQTYALGRITETCIGIVTFIVVETCLWPNRAATLVREALVETLQDSRECFAAVVRSYMEDECAFCRQKAVEQVAATEKSIGALVQKQGPLIDEAASEPDFWRAPFPIPVYTKLVDLQRRMARLLYAMDCSLRATGLEASGEQSEKLVKPLQGPLRSLEAEVLLTLDSLISALRAPCRAFDFIATRPQDEEKHNGGPHKETELTSTVSRPKVSDDASETVDPHSTSESNGTDAIAESDKGQGEEADSDTDGSLDEDSLYADEDTNKQAVSADIESQEALGHTENGHTSSSGKEDKGDQKHHKHHIFGRHRRKKDKRVEAEVFEHPMHMNDAESRLGKAGGVNIRQVFQEFEDRYEDVISGLISVKLANPGIRIVDNTSMLSFNALVFSMRALIAEANDLENTIRELLQVESPIDLTKCMPPLHVSQSEPLLNKGERRQQ